MSKTITLGGQEFKIEDLPFKSLKKFIPAVSLATVKLQNMSEITEDDFEQLLIAVHIGISHCNEITLDQLEDLPIKLIEIGTALRTLIEISGLEQTTKGEAKAAA